MWVNPVLSCALLKISTESHWKVLLGKDMYNSDNWSLYRHMVYSVPVSCKANQDRNQLRVWLGSDLIVE